ncbi:hypothetical protein B4072_2941 [Bacillus subtilis]|nr:hypothetical protein B4069_2960 [Bacillus subtilis]KIN46712.1 hypothetical protein B4072_2941 [Bacillus subtilis]
MHIKWYAYRSQTKSPLEALFLYDESFFIEVHIDAGHRK